MDLSSSSRRGTHTGEKTTGVSYIYTIRNLNLQMEVENGKSGYVNTHGHDILKSVEDPEKRQKLSQILVIPKGGGDLNVWTMKWACSLCYQLPNSEFKGLYRFPDCQEPALFCGWCWSGLSELVNFKRCPFGCGLQGDLKDCQFAPYPRKLMKILVEKEKQQMIKVAYLKSSSYQRMLRYDVLRKKRIDNCPIRISQKELAADLMMADMAEKADEEFEKSLEVKMAQLDNKEKNAYNKLVKAFNSDVILHEDVFNIKEYFEKSQVNGLVFPVSCTWKNCELKFRTRELLDIHKAETQHFEYVCARKHCQYKTSRWWNFKRHYTNAWEEKTNQRCPDIKNKEEKRLVQLTCTGCGRSFARKTTLRRHQTNEKGCGESRNRMQVC